MSTILQGRCLMTTKPFLRKAEHWRGKVRDAPASAVSKVSSCCDRSCQGLQCHRSRVLSVRRFEWGGGGGGALSEGWCLPAHRCLPPC